MDLGLKRALREEGRDTPKRAGFGFAPTPSHRSHGDEVAGPRREPCGGGGG